MLNGLLLIFQLWKGFEPFVRRHYRGDTWAGPKFPSNTAGTWVQPRVVIRLPRSCFKRPVLTPISSDTTVRDTALSLHVCSITAGTQRLCEQRVICVCRWTAAAHMCWLLFFSYLWPLQINCSELPVWCWYDYPRLIIRSLFAKCLSCHVETKRHDTNLLTMRHRNEKQEGFCEPRVLLTQPNVSRSKQWR